jgi:hypothetical protein
MPMAEPRDPIEEWLGSDIELMQPRPGAFERIRHRARRRKATRALATAAGAFVIVAAAWTGPQFASLLPGDSGITKIMGGPSPQARSAKPSSHPAPSAGPSKPGNGFTHPAGPVPPAFRPESVTFVGTAAGAVLGQSAVTCPSGPCTAVAATASYGASWFGAGTVPAGPPAGDTGVSQVRFLDLHNGWAFGPQLFATHDGGRHWTEITALPPGRVIDLSTVGSRVFAVVARCSGTGASYAAGCTSFELVSASATSDSSWAPVPGAAARLPVSPGGLQLTSQRGYLLAHGQLFTGPVSAGPWHAVPVSASAPPCLRGTTHRGWQPGSGLLAPTLGAVYLACTSGPGSHSPRALTSPVAYYSADGGATWHSRGTLPAPLATSLAAAPGGGLVLATSAGIYYSPDAASWHRAHLTQPPPGGFSFVGMTTRLRGVAVPSDSRLGEVFTTADGGLSWQRSPIR